MKKQRLILPWAAASLVILFAVLSAKAKDWPLAIPKGSTVVLKVPTGFWQVAKYDVASKSGQRIYFVDIANLFSNTDWEKSGFPYCGEFTVTKIFEYKPYYKLLHTDVELRNESFYVKLRFPAGENDLSAEFQKTVVPGNWQQFENSADFRKNVFAVQEARIFTGQLAALSDDTKTSLLHMVCDGQNTFKTEVYKDKSYFAVALETGSDVYNSIRLNASARVTRVINERLLNRIKMFRGIAQQAGIGGVKLAVKIPYRNFLNETISHDDDLEVYVPLDLCMKFADADITSQQLIDGSIVILNGNRIQVSLSETSS